MSSVFLKFSQILSQGYTLPYFSGFSAFMLFIVGNIGACLYSASVCGKSPSLLSSVSPPRDDARSFFSFSFSNFSMKPLM